MQIWSGAINQNKACYEHHNILEPFHELSKSVKNYSTPFSSIFPFTQSNLNDSFHPNSTLIVEVLHHFVSSFNWFNNLTERGAGINVISFSWNELK